MDSRADDCRCTGGPTRPGNAAPCSCQPCCARLCPVMPCCARWWWWLGQASNPMSACWRRSSPAGVDLLPAGIDLVPVGIDSSAHGHRSSAPCQILRHAPRNEESGAALPRLSSHDQHYFAMCQVTSPLKHTDSCVACLHGHLATGTWLLLLPPVRSCNMHRAQGKGLLSGATLALLVSHNQHCLVMCQATSRSPSRTQAVVSPACTARGCLTHKPGNSNTC